MSFEAFGEGTDVPKLNYESMPREELIAELHAWNNRFEDRVATDVADKTKEVKEDYISKTNTLKESIARYKDTRRKTLTQYLEQLIEENTGFFGKNKVARAADKLLKLKKEENK